MSASGPSVGATGHFVGREQETAVSLQLFEVAAGGSLRVLLLGGEPGIGKTALMRRMGEHARLRTATVMSGGASQAEGMPPYLPLLEALGPYVRDAPPEVLREQVGPWAGSLDVILPELPVRGDMAMMRITLPPGWRWSKDLKAAAGTDSCQAPHFQYHVSGRLHVKMDDGSEAEFGPGEVSVLPPGHDAWVIGDDPVVTIDVTGANVWAK